MPARPLPRLVPTEALAVAADVISLILRNNWRLSVSSQRARLILELSEYTVYVLSLNTEQSFLPRAQR